MATPGASLTPPIKHKGGFPSGVTELAVKQSDTSTSSVLLILD